MEAILAGVSILVVEDEPDSREVLERALNDCGADVRAVDSAESARCVLAMHTPDVIVSDIGMADEDGCSLMRSIRSLANAAKRSVPTVALSAYSGPSARDRALRAGFDVYLVKPVRPWVLAQLLRELISAPSSQEWRGSGRECKSL